MKYREMQKLLKYKGLNAKGSTEELEARLAEANDEPMKLEPVEAKPEKKTGYTNGFKFVGGGYGDPEWVSLYGYMFGLNGKVVEVNDDAAAKLRNRGYFKEV